MDIQTNALVLQLFARGSAGRDGDSNTIAPHTLYIISSLTQHSSAHCAWSCFSTGTTGVLALLEKCMAADSTSRTHDTHHRRKVKVGVIFLSPVEEEVALSLSFHCDRRLLRCIAAEEPPCPRVAVDLLRDAMLSIKGKDVSQQRSSEKRLQ